MLELDNGFVEGVRYLSRVVALRWYDPTTRWRGTLEMDGMCLPGDENRADDHFARGVVVCRGENVYVQ